MKLLGLWFELVRLGSAAGGALCGYTAGIGEQARPRWVFHQTAARTVPGIVFVRAQIRTFSIDEDILRENHLKRSPGTARLDLS